MKELGLMQYFLGLEVWQSKISRYIKKHMSRTPMEGKLKVDTSSNARNDRISQVKSIKTCDEHNLHNTQKSSIIYTKMK
jgi:hypothetical protein